MVVRCGGGVLGGGAADAEVKVAVAWEAGGEDQGRRRGGGDGGDVAHPVAGALHGVHLGHEVVVVVVVVVVPAVVWLSMVWVSVVCGVVRGVAGVVGCGVVGRVVVLLRVRRRRRLQVCLEGQVRC